jgi:hypothetical protein
MGRRFESGGTRRLHFQSSNPNCVVRNGEVAPYFTTRACDRLERFVRERLWHDPRTPDRERKPDGPPAHGDVTLIKAAEGLTADIRFQSGATTLTLPRTLNAWQQTLTYDANRNLATHGVRTFARNGERRFESTVRQMARRGARRRVQPLARSVGDDTSRLSGAWRRG